MVSKVKQSKKECKDPETLKDRDCGRKKRTGDTTHNNNGPQINLTGKMGACSVVENWRNRGACTRSLRDLYSRRHCLMGKASLTVRGKNTRAGERDMCETGARQMKEIATTYRTGSAKKSLERGPR